MPKSRIFFGSITEGTEDVTASLSVTLDAATLSGEADVSVSSALSQTLGALTLSGASQVSVVATSSVTLDAATLASTATVEWPGVGATLSVTLDAVTLSGAAQVSVTSTATPTLGDLTLSSTVAVTSGPSATLSVTLEAATLSSTTDQNYPITRTIRNQARTIMPGATVLLLVKATRALEDESVSDTGGSVTFWVDDKTVDYLLVAYLEGTPDLAGAVINAKGDG